MKRSLYKVVGPERGEFAVVLRKGGIEYDNLESRTLARDICSILNRGVGPEWDAVEPHLPKAES